MKEHIAPAIRLTIVLAILLCGVYPAAVWAIGQLAFRHQANGSLIVRDGKVVGSELIGQQFTSARYFHSRPSAAGDGYDATNSSGSNLGPTSKKLADQIAENIAALEKEGIARPVPADAVTASGSGLDPHISPEYARAQAPRVAKANGMAIAKIMQMINARTEGRFVGIFGEPRVNVLLLNLDLFDAARSRKAAH
ncbi:MAG TPA: K(+)-transporting ATPase subunit C [Thermoanaerobaculia bacterium]|nr:K(+)-transporting ATPase subunit C [Thermoanaerobaculia bacterium]